MLRLWEMPGWGSAIVELQLALYGMPHELVRVTAEKTPEAVAAALAPVNPLRQVPVLELPSGMRMTESAAITLYLADLAASDLLVPGPEAPERADFLRWLIFLVAQIYPCFAFADVPTRFVPEAGASAYRAAVDAHEARLWQVFAAPVTGPWVLGERFSALDLYVAVMVNWRPGRAWFADEAPALLAIAEAVAARPELAGAWARNFG